jgi:hypothetical protein
MGNIFEKSTPEPILEPTPEQPSLTQLKQYFSENVVTMRTLKDIHHNNENEELELLCLTIRLCNNIHVPKYHIESFYLIGPLCAFLIDNKYDENDKTNMIPLTCALETVRFKEHNNYLRNICPNMENFCVGVNIYEDIDKLKLETDLVDKHILSLEITIVADLLRNINIYLFDFDETQEPYEINAWIEYDEYKYSFENIKAQKNIKLDIEHCMFFMPHNKFNEHAKRRLRVEIPYNKYNEWEHTLISCGCIYVTSDKRQILLSKMIKNKNHTYFLTDYE